MQTCTRYISQVGRMNTLNNEGPAASNFRIRSGAAVPNTAPNRALSLPIPPTIGLYNRKPERAIYRRKEEEQEAEVRRRQERRPLYCNRNAHTSLLGYIELLQEKEMDSIAPIVSLPLSVRRQKECCDQSIDGNAVVVRSLNEHMSIPDCLILNNSKLQSQWPECHSCLT